MVSQQFGPIAPLLTPVMPLKSPQIPIFCPPTFCDDVIYECPLLIFRARGHDNGLPCSKLEVCETCDPGAAECSTPDKYYQFRVDEYADVEGDTPQEQVANMMAEIYHRGPIACGIGNYT